MKARHVLWPVMILGAVTIAGACSSGGASGDGAGIVGGADAGGGDGNGTGDTGSGATSSMGATDAGGGMSNSGDSGASTGGISTGSGGDAVGGAGGAAINLCEGQDLNCEDDNDPCTEDECNPATGECGIPRDGTECDDGLFCNGADSCVEGACTGHDGSPCTGTCNEGGDYCECGSKDDCPADEVGDWDGECVYANACVETGSRSRIITKYSCNEVGKCIGAPVVDNDTCPRDTDGLDCEDDGKRCTTTDKCSAGTCVHSGSPCSGATPGCYESGTMCEVCAGNVGCGGGEKCCNRACIPSGNICKIILPAATTIVISAKLP